jgi:hypothetical protein
MGPMDRLSQLAKVEFKALGLLLELTARVFGLGFQLDMAKCLNNPFNSRSLRLISAGQ